MDAPKGQRNEAVHAGPVKLVQWAWRRRSYIAFFVLIVAATLILGPWRLGSRPLAVPVAEAVIKAATMQAALPVKAPIPDRTSTPTPTPFPAPSLIRTFKPMLAPAKVTASTPAPSPIHAQTPTPKHTPAHTPAPTTAPTVIPTSAPTLKPTPNPSPTTTPAPFSPEEALRRCLWGVVTVEKGGGFGNCFMEWASAWAVARKYNLTLATPTNLYQTLRQAFSDVPTGPTVAALLKDCPFGSGLCEEDAFKNTVKRENIPEAVPAFASAVTHATAAAPAPGPLALPMYVVSPSFISEFREELRAQVRWRPELRKRAQYKLRQKATEVADRFGAAPHEVVFVGVHVRRTDYPWWIKARLSKNVEADADYYVRAVLRVVRTLEEEAEKETGRAGAAGPVAAVVASDEMHWVRRHLLPALDNMARTSELRVMSFAAGGGTALQDLALLSACNHTAMAYGTYGMTAALLAGGYVVAFDLDDTYPSSQFAGLLPGWIVTR